MPVENSRGFIKVALKDRQEEKDRISERNRWRSKGKCLQYYCNRMLLYSHMEDFGRLLFDAQRDSWINISVPHAPIS